jgi:general stress protein 26
MSESDLAAMAKRLLDSNRYMTIATVGDDGHPWATPVHFSPDRYRHMFWISDPEAQHSRNIRARPEVWRQVLRGKNR